MSRSASNSKEASSLAWVQVVLIIAAFALLLIGYVVVYSSSQATILTDAASAGSLDTANAAQKLIFQVLYSGIGIVIAIAIYHFGSDFWRGIPMYIYYALCLVLLALTLVMGASALGATRWLPLGPFSLQPSEFAKIAFIMMAARIMDDYRDERLDLKQAGIATVLFILLPLLFLYKSQSDLGTTAIIIMGCLAIMWLAGVSWKVLACICAALGIFAAVAIFGTGYRQDRLVVYNPWNDGQNGYGDGYQTIHSFYAFAQGGLFGVGLGNSAEKFDYLPEAETDFAFSIIGEEFGMLGALIVIALFMVVLFCGMKIASQAASLHGTLLAGGCTVMLVFQAFLNMGCVIGCVPTTGKPLPFISYGGSSVISTLILIGVILSVARVADQSDVYERRRADLRVVRTRDGDADDNRHGASRGRFASDATHGSASAAARTHFIDDAFETSSRRTLSRRSRR